MLKRIAGRLCPGLLALFAVVILLAAPFFTAGTARAATPMYDVCTEYPSNPVFDPAERVYYPSIIYGGSTYHLWYDNGTTTMYSTSADGITWAAGVTASGFSANARHPHVEQVGSGYRIWYWDDSVSIYSINAIRTAVSSDGINWTSDQAVTQIGTTVITSNPGPDWNAGTYGVCDVFYNAGGSASIVTPVDAASVWQNKFVIYYDGTNGGYEDIGLAVSADGIQWQGYNGGAAPVLAHSGGAAWDSDYATFSSIQVIGGVYHMWYSGGQTASNEGIGYAQSSDGLTWTKDAGNPMLHITDGVAWRAGRTYTPAVIYNAGGSGNIQMWYNGTAGGNYALGYAGITAPVPPPTTTTAAPATVGGEIGRVNKVAVIAPYAGVLLAIGLALILRKNVIKTR